MGKSGRVVHCKVEPYDVYIGRPSKWGNPFSMDTHTREEAVAKYREWVVQQPNLMKDLPELYGKTLGCWCAPKACHGDVLLELTKKQRLLDLYKKNVKCAKCPLSPQHCANNRVVVGRGNINAQLMILGEAPGADEDISGKPFVGMAGKMLDRLLEESKIEQDNVYITNPVKCRPITPASRGGFKNRPPTDPEIAACKVWLWQEMQILRPKAIITLGKVPTSLLLGVSKSLKLKDYMGDSHAVTFIDALVFPCWHPSYIMRSQSKFFEPALEVFNNVATYLESCK